MTTKKKNTINRQGMGKLTIILSFVVLSFIAVAKLFDVYKIAVVGAVFEILWLPMILLLFILPILSIIYWAQEKFSARSVFLYAILISITAIILMVYYK